jgi:hypothetical protein
MQFLKGLISNRIRDKNTDIPPDVRHKLDSRSDSAADAPSDKAVRGGKGRGLGQGAHRRRSGDKG